ncbi:MAG: hypothetical protein HY047_00260 [Acidobacteria bacterium]|nr:hypothetical protein [Acidobacteriota bacterium]
MSALSLGTVRRWSLGILARVVLCGTVSAALAACSSGGQAPQAANAPIAVQTSQMFVTVENKAGLPLVDVDVAILPVGGPAVFTKLVERIENGEKRDLSLGDFSQGGTTFSLRIMRPKTVRVRAKDVVGKTYEVSVPW